MKDWLSVLVVLIAVIIKVQTFFFGSALARSWARRSLSSWCSFCWAIFSSRSLSRRSFSL